MAGFDRGYAENHVGNLSSAEGMQPGDIVFFMGELKTEKAKKRCEPYKMIINGKEGYRFLVRSIQGNVLHLGSNDQDLLLLGTEWKRSSLLQRINGIR